MSLIHLGNACSHLQNASKARLGLTSVVRTNLLHGLLIQMQRQGYVRDVNLGGQEPPAPGKLAPIMSVNPETGGELSGHVAQPNEYEDEGGSEGTGTHSADMEGRRRRERRDGEEGERASWGKVTMENVSSRRLWIGLKYWNSRPVLEKMQLVSKPSRRVWASISDMEGLIRGEKVGYVKGLRGIGEAMYATTDRGIMDIRECVERKTGGMLLCRVNPP